MKCTNCSNEFKGNFCPYCGAKASDIKPTEQKQEHKSQSKSESSSAEIPKASELFKYAADSYINRRFKLIWIGAVGSAIFMMAVGMIGYGIGMMILGILLMPFMLKRYKKWMIYALVFIAILYAAWVAVEWESRSGEDTTAPSVTQTETVETNKQGSDNGMQNSIDTFSRQTDTTAATSQPSGIPSQEPSPAVSSQTEYIIPDSDVIEIDIGYLRGLTEEELVIARNEIYARHGREFQLEWLQEYFNSCSWYTANPNYNYDNEDSMLNAVELHNVKVIADYENSFK